jgi:hypothetical protein
VQAAESELRNGPGEITTKRTTNNQTSGYVESQIGPGAHRIEVKVKNPNAPAVTREAQEDWAR